MSILTIVAIAVVLIVILKAVGFLIKNIAIIAIGIAILVGGYVAFNQYKKDITSYSVKDATKLGAKVVKTGISVANEIR